MTTTAITEWTIKAERDGRKWIASARRGRESVYGRHGKTEAEAVASCKARLRDSGYAE